MAAKNLTIEKLLSVDKQITYKVMGKSMLPMIIPNRDLVTIRSKHPDEVFKEDDIVLYRQKGNLTLHRIVGVMPNKEYILLGDNCSRKEYGISDNDIIGLLTRFKHNGYSYTIDSPKYMDYVKSLRNHRDIRRYSKLVYDIIIQHLTFLQTKTYVKAKRFLYSMIVFKIKFD